MASIAAVIDRYAERESPVHRAAARLKVVVALAYIFVVVATPEGAWTALVLMAAPLPVLALASRLTPLLVLRRTFIALPFVLVALPLAFTRPGETVLTLPFLGWTASREGVEAVVTILARSWIAVAVAVLLTATTPVVELLHALRSLGLPRILVATVSFAYRYFFVLADEAVRMMRARESRSPQSPGARSGGSLTWRARVTGHMVGSLFVRSLERSERIYAAMLSRGYDGEARFLRLAPPLARAEVAWGVALIAYLVAAQAGMRFA
jgi:cobalt/nickel transport system permease protein